MDPADGNWYLRLDKRRSSNQPRRHGLGLDPCSTGSANGRAYFGFGTTVNGTLSAVLAPNTRQLLIQSDAGFGTFTNLASVAQSYQANHWYLVSVAWGKSGTVTVNLYDSNGTSLLKSVTVATGDTTPARFAFRAIGSAQDWDTVRRDAHEVKLRSRPRKASSVAPPTAPATRGSWGSPSGPETGGAGGPMNAVRHLWCGWGHTTKCHPRRTFPRCSSLTRRAQKTGSAN